jgi:small subunit ribosomal protein S6
MGEDKQNLYEGMYIISATLSEDARSKALERVQNEITSRGGEIHKVHDQGKKRMAYEIDGHREGHYFLIYFSVDPAVISELWSEYHLHEDLVRFLTLRTDKVLEKIEFKALAESQ